MNTNTKDRKIKTKKNKYKKVNIAEDEDGEEILGADDDDCKLD